MANLTIAQLVQINASGVDNADLLPLWDDSATETKRISVAQFKTLIGAVTSVGASAPISSSGGLTPTISISQSSAATDGYLSSADWNTFNNKQDLLVSTVNIKSINGSSILGAGNLTIGTINWSETFSSATQATSQWTPNNAAANVNAAITPKGTGALVAQIPDGTTAGGNPRGTYSVDFQMSRNNANQVASGSNSAIVAGVNSQITGNNSFSGSGASSVITGSSSAIIAGTSNNISQNNSIIGSGQNNTISAADSMIGSGIQSTISAQYGYIGGGRVNTVSAAYGFVGGGQSCTASGVQHSTVGGGLGNAATRERATVCGGYANSANGQSDFIGGGEQNATYVGGNVGDYGGNRFIGGGQYNQMGANYNSHSAIVCGFQNTIASNGSVAFIGSGRENTVSASYAACVGGGKNEVSGLYAFIGAGGNFNVPANKNTASGGWSVIGGGMANIGGIEGGVVVGGFGNSAYGYGFIGAGRGNTVGSATPIVTGNSNITSGSTSASYFFGITTGQLVVGNGIPNGTYVVGVGTPNFTLSNAATQTGTVSLSFYHAHMVVCGGLNNTASFSRCFVGGGFSNTASSNLANTVVGGASNTASGNGYNFVGGGQSNVASGTYDVVVGGNGNYVQGTDNGNYRFVGGGQNNGMNTQTNYSLIVGGNGNTVSIGQNNFMGAGQGNTVGSQWGVLVGGRQNTMTSGTPNYSFLGGGYLNTISAAQAVCVGGEQNTSSAAYSSILGGLQGSATLYGQQAYASGRLSANGDAQSHELIWRRLITGTAQTELFLDGTSVAAILPATNCLWQGTIEIASICTVVGNGTTTLGDAQGSTYKVTIKRLGTTTALVGTVQEIGTGNADPSALGIFTIDANDTNESLRIQFTPPPSAGSTTVHRVVATFRGLQIQY